MAYTQTLNTPIFYEITGDSNKPHLLLMNGITMNTQGWGLMMPFLESHFCIIRLDFLGQGQSSKLSQDHYPLADQARVAYELLNELNIQQVHLVGLSYGGMVAQYFARDYANKLASLQLFSTLPFSDATNQALHASWLESELKGGSDLRFDVSVPWMFSHKFLNSQSHLLPVLKNMAATVHWESAYALSKGVMLHDARAWLSQITLPTHVVIGSEDRLTPPYFSQYLAKHIPNSQLSYVFDHAHALHIEAPQEFSQHIIDFITGLS